MSTRDKVFVALAFWSLAGLTSFFHFLGVPLLTEELTKNLVLLFIAIGGVSTGILPERYHP